MRREPSKQEAIEARQRAMALLARTCAGELDEPVARRWAEHGARDLKPAETGLVMLRGRAGGDGAPFNLGEATVTRAIVELPSGERGYIVAAAARGAGLRPDAAKARAGSLLHRLNLPERLWPLPPATFSGGEQQRVNIARGFAGEHGLLILDEPTASLDAANREAVVELIAERRASGAGFLAIFHDDDVRLRLADRVIDVSAFSTREAA